MNFLTMNGKQFISLEQLRLFSFQMASNIYNDPTFKPDFIVAIWRGGAPIGMYIHEFLKYNNQHTDHITIRTSRYTGIDKVSSHGVAVHNLGYLTERLRPESKVLLVDDVFDSGLSIQAILDAFREKLGDNCPLSQNIKVATVFYKPKNNKTTLLPDYFIHKSDQWLVFPHEVEGLTNAEIDAHMGPDIAKLFTKIK